MGWVNEELGITFERTSEIGDITLETLAKNSGEVGATIKELETKLQGNELYYACFLLGCWNMLIEGREDPIMFVARSMAFNEQFTKALQKYKKEKEE